MPAEDDAAQKVLVLVINLDRRPERLERMAARLGELGVSWRRLAAVDGLAGEAEGSDVRFVQHWDDGPWAGPQMACVLSHRRAWREFLASDRDELVVLEDDVDMAAGLGRLVARGLGLPGLAVPVKLEWHANSVFPPPLVSAGLLRPADELGELRQLRSAYLGSAGYWLSRRGAEALLARTLVVRRPVDLVLFDPSPLRPGSGAVVLNPPLVTQRKELLGTDIQAQTPRLNQRQRERRKRRLLMIWKLKKFVLRGVILPGHSQQWQLTGE